MVTTRSWYGYWISDKRCMSAPSTTVAAAPYYRKTFHCAEVKKNATIYLSGLGYHELYVNGQKVDDRVLAPVVTQYDKHVPYIAYDVTSLIRPGDNCLVVWLGNGWYNCHTAEVWSFDKAPWRDWPKLRCDLEVDGKIIVKSDRSWKFADSPITFDALRNGEFYDARRENPDVFYADFDDSSWENAAITSPPPGKLILEELEPCKIMHEYASVAVAKQNSNSIVYDFGTNLTGWAKIRLRAQAGIKIELTYSELVRPISGDLDREYIDRFIKDGKFQFDTYITSGSDQGETWSPRFTYHGFRYVKVTFSNGIPDEFAIDACFVHNAFAKIGSFVSSNPVLNRLQEITCQSYLCNFTGIPTDCPHREKNGWTGDAAIAAATGMWNFDASKAYEHFTRIVSAAQRSTGQLSGINPTGGWGFNWGSGPAWDILLYEYPWQVYLFTGNLDIIKENYANFVNYFNYCCEYYDEERILNFGLGDWCPVDSTHAPEIGVTSTGYYHCLVRRMAKFAELVGDTDKVTDYINFGQEIVAAYNKKYYHGQGEYANNSVTALSAALYFDFVPADDVQLVTDKLVKLVRDNHHKADFGILGAQYTPRVLADHGYIDDAYKLLSQTEFPGWGFWVKSGATTLWEHWRGVASQNHIMFGDVSAWMFQYLGGICPDIENPGFTRFQLKPYFPAGLDAVTVRHHSPHGEIHSEWRRDVDQIICSFAIPENSEAEIILPGHKSRTASGKVEIVVKAKYLQK